MVADSQGGWLADRLPSPATWPAIEDGLKVQRLAALAHDAIIGGLPATEQQVDAVDRLRRKAAAVDLAAEGALADVQGVLANAGIEWRLLKGMATGHLWYETPALRHTSDVDLLVHQADYRQSVSVLGGLLPRSVLARGPAVADARPAMSFHHPSGIEIDLHGRIEGTPASSRVKESVAWADPQAIELPWGQARALSPDAMALHVLLHLTASYVRLTSVVDLRLALARRDVDWDRVSGLTAGPWRSPLWWGLARASFWLEPGDLDRANDVTPVPRIGASMYAALLSTDWGQQFVWLLAGRRRLARLRERIRPTAEFQAWRSQQQPR